MFIGWEGVGLASYLLIGFWFTKDSAASAGKKAFIVNRIGDFGFLIALFLMIQHFGSLNFMDVAQRVTPMGRGDRRRRSADGDWFAVDGRRGGKVGTDSALRLAARRHGRPDTGFRIDSRGHYGDRRRVYGFAVACDFRTCAHRIDGGRHHRHTDGAVRGDHRRLPNRH